MVAALQWSIHGFPWLALVLWPLGRLPYVTAHAIWLVTRFVAIRRFPQFYGRIPDRRSQPRRCAAGPCRWPWDSPTARMRAVFSRLWLALSERFRGSDQAVPRGRDPFPLHRHVPPLSPLLPVLYLIHRRWQVIAGFSGWGRGSAGAVLGGRRLGLVGCMSAGSAGSGYQSIAMVHAQRAWFFPSSVCRNGSRWRAWSRLARFSAMSRLDYLPGLVALTGSLLSYQMPVFSRMLCS